MLTEQEARARAQRGASVLDEYCPGWERVIDLDWFLLSASGRCIIGQLSDVGYSGMIEDMGLSFDDDEDVSHGFDIGTGEDYSVQQAAWVDLIQERRGEA